MPTNFAVFVFTMCLCTLTMVVVIFLTRTEIVHHLLIIKAFSTIFDNNKHLTGWSNKHFNINWKPTMSNGISNASTNRPIDIFDVMLFNNLLDKLLTFMFLALLFNSKTRLFDYFSFDLLDRVFKIKMLKHLLYYMIRKRLQNHSNNICGDIDFQNHSKF